MPVSRNNARLLAGLLLFAATIGADAQTLSPAAGPVAPKPAALGPPIPLAPAGVVPAPPPAGTAPATVTPLAAGTLGATPLAAPNPDEAGALPADAKALPCCESWCFFVVDVVRAARQARAPNALLSTSPLNACHSAGSFTIKITS